LAANINVPSRINKRITEKINMELESAQ